MTAYSLCWYHPGLEILFARDSTSSASQLGLLDGSAGSIIGRWDLLSRSLFGQSHCSCCGLCIWMGLLVENHVHIGPCGWNEVELLTVLCGQVEPFTGLCNKLWLGEFAGCVPWQCGAFWQGYRLGSTIPPVGWNLSLWLEGPLAGLCVLAEPQAGLHTWTGTQTVVCSQVETQTMPWIRVKLQAGFQVHVGHWLYRQLGKVIGWASWSWRASCFNPALGWDKRLCSAVGQSHCLGILIG